ncbi:MAG: hypothetical protein CSA55_03765 [Ilumatobacter coccineus]|uniref:Uncharacterized protein n=1 Tax=Ilumatobacter coccineus TaxID=467094 RepID=A0A2G6K9E6_9ACTN|nr:MAG: hypothetical protein CSA55_03765 [Ilumatobacter coccineus]
MSRSVVSKTSLGPVRISSSPTADETAAIVAALDALWPRPMALEPVHRRSKVWKFSGRSWHRDRRSRADRPWR